jgi:apolipoprotein N-acyltransferase
MSQLTDAPQTIPSVTRELKPASRVQISRRAAVPYLLLGAGLLISLVAGGRWIVPVAAWIWPVFLVRYLRGERPLRGFVLAAVGMSLVSFVAYWGMVPAPAVLFYPILILTSLCQLLPFAVDRWLAPRLHGLPRTLVLPTAIVTMDFLTAAFSPYGTWGNIAYSQFGNLALLQVLSVTGLYGIGFLIGWFAAVVNEAWEGRFEWRRIWRPVAVFGVVFAVVYVAGAGRLVFSPPTATTVRVASITAPDKLRDSMNPGQVATELHVTYEGAITDPIWQAMIHNSQALCASLAEQSRREARAGAKIVFWPEGQAVVPKESEAELLKLGQETARNEKIYLGLGTVVAHREQGSLKIENRFVMLDPEGKTVFDYTKQKPVPGGEAAMCIIPVHDYRLPTVDTPYGRIAGAICFDMDFPWLIRQAGTARADMLLVPANDWPAIDPLHTHMACLRAIETGCSVVRHTSQGLSSAVDPQGHVLAQMDHYTTPDTERVMITHVPTHGSPTFYARFGDVFSWLCIAGLCILVLASVLRVGRT